jgi:MFS family permease
LEYERTAIKKRKIPVITGIIPLFIMFWLGFIIWWSLMYNLFFEGRSIEGLAVGYILPSAYSVVAYIASRNTGRVTYIAHFITFAILSLVYAAIMVSLGYRIPAKDAGPFLGTAFIAAIMSLMQYPMAGLQDYFKYRTPLFIAGVIFMPLFIYFASMLPSIYQRYLGLLLAQGLDPRHAAHEARHTQA